MEKPQKTKSTINRFSIRDPDKLIKAMLSGTGFWTFIL
jgi:hypothetical protein